jgi:hypothetical protein
MEVGLCPCPRGNPASRGHDLVRKGPIRAGLRVLAPPHRQPRRRWLVASARAGLRAFRTQLISLVAGSVVRGRGVVPGQVVVASRS